MGLISQIKAGRLEEMFTATARNAFWPLYARGQPARNVSSVKSREGALCVEPDLPACSRGYVNSPILTSVFAHNYV